MLNRIFIVLGLSLSLFSNEGRSLAVTGADALDKAQVTFTSKDRDQTFNETLMHLRSMFSRYKPAVDGGTKITSPLVMSGTETQPTFKASFQKCIFIVCKDVDVVGDVHAEKRQGSCAQDYVITANLQRSSELLSNLYDRLDVFVCLQPVGADGMQLKFIVSAHQAPGYSQGIVQQNAFDLLKLQSQPMLKAVRDALVSNGAVIKK